MTKKEVCEKTGIKYQLLNVYQSSPDRKISAEWVYLIARCTGVTTDFIFEHDDEQFEIKDKML